jgi:ring-1,2-phenylacetyl-CoA epoxidase subunit PaaC
MAQTSPVFTYALRLADDALVLGHRLSEWCGRAPMLEEELALANMGLDLIGQARSFYAYAGLVEGRGRSEDQLVYFRDATDYSNLLLVEQPPGDFAFTIARQCAYAAFALPFFQHLSRSRDETLAGIAAKAEKEMAYHLRHCGEWLIRLGDGTPESHSRAQEAIEDVAPYIGEMFQMDALETGLLAQTIAVDRAALRPDWNSAMQPVLAEAGLEWPSIRYDQSGGRQGLHGEHLGVMLATMQSLARAMPDARW